MRFANAQRRFPLALAIAAAASTVRAQTESDFNAARVAWERGDYPVALRGYERLLSTPDAARYLERIALITGELYRTTELTTDGRALKVSPSGRWIAYERGVVPNVWTMLVPSDNPERKDSIAGTSIAFDEGRARVAVVRMIETPAVAAARADSMRLAADADQATRAAAGRRVRELQSFALRLVVRDLAAGTERVVGGDTLAVASPDFAPDGRLLFIGRRTGESGTHVWSLSTTDGALDRLTSTEALRSILQVLPGGRAVLFALGQDPFAVAGGRGGGGGRAGGPGGAGGGPAFVIRDLSSGAERSFSGTLPSVSADGAVLAYLERRTTDTVINVVDLVAGGAPMALNHARGRIDAPAIAPDGKRVAYQLMSREDWEIYVIDADGKNERRLTYEIQHDILPRWLTPTTLLGMIGEARHRRSHLYEVATGARRRLFHNNTIRTVAPEYAWLSSSDGRKVVVNADRDGNTISVQRGVYLVDLAAPVTREELLVRVRSQLTAELALRAESKQRFAPLAAEVKAVTDNVSKDRIYGYARDLYGFDSKHVSQPGNAKAIAYLDSVYKSFGYETTLQWFQPTNGNRTANVVATLKGTASPDAVYVVGSHFDSVAGGPGADDNTSGTTMLLETARVLAKHPLPATVVFVSFTGEEAGLLGSREFVRRMRADSVRLVGALNNDMMGWSNDQRLDNTIRYSNPGIRDVQHGAALEFSRLITYDALYYQSTDAAAFLEAYGDIVGGFGSYPILGNPHYHQPHDVLETINFEQMAENTKANVATMMLLASAPSRPAGLVAERTGAGASVRWNANPEKDIRNYLVRWTDRRGVTHTQRAEAPRMTIAMLRPGDRVMVKAVNTRGIDGWDWARVVVQ